jgi:hypothetical protein
MAVGHDQCVEWSALGYVSSLNNTMVVRQRTLGERTMSFEADTPWAFPHYKPCLCTIHPSLANTLQVQPRLVQCLDAAAGHERAPAHARTEPDQQDAG